MLHDAAMFLFASLMSLGIVVATALASIVTVKPDEKAAYTVLGEYRGMLDTGMHRVVPYVSDVFHYEESPTVSVTEEANTADGGRVEATVEVELERGDIARAFETDGTVSTDPVAELRAESRELLREELRDRNTETMLSAHVDIERALARELRESAREYYHHLASVDTLAIERVERPAVPEN